MARRNILTREGKFLLLSVVLLFLGLSARSFADTDAGHVSAPIATSIDTLTAAPNAPELDAGTIDAGTPAPAPAPVPSAPIDWLALLKNVALVVGLVIAGAARLANRVSPTTDIGKIVHVIGQNGPEIQQAIATAEKLTPEVQKLFAEFLAQRNVGAPSAK